MPRRIANENRTEAAYLTVSQIATALSCDRGMVYGLIEKGELLGVRPFHQNGILRVPVQSFRDYEERLAAAAECRLSGASTTPTPKPAKRRPQVKVDHAGHRAANEWLRANGIIR